MIKIISHRGNLNGPNSCEENKPEWLEHVISLGYDVEIDLWYIGSFYLGHDMPEYKISKKWLEKNKKYIWIHCKNKEALFKMSKMGNKYNYFWHENDRYALTSKSLVWVYPNQKLLKNSICVLPELGINGNIDKCYGVCTDYPIVYREKNCLKK